jgi:hypothetical protein
LHKSTINAFMARKKQDAEAVLDPIKPNNTTMPTEAAVLEVETSEASKSNKIKVSGERKAGQELLDFVQANQSLPPEDLAFGAGYYTKETDSETGETSTRLHKNEFFKAVTEASTGIAFVPAKRAYTARRGRAPVITVGKTGNCVVGARHATIAGFQPGGKVTVTAEQGKIVLTPCSDSDAADEASDDDLDL